MQNKQINYRLCCFGIRFSTAFTLSTTKPWHINTYSCRVGDRQAGIHMCKPDTSATFINTVSKSQFFQYKLKAGIVLTCRMVIMLSISFPTTAWHHRLKSAANASKQLLRFKYIPDILRLDISIHVLHHAYLRACLIIMQCRRKCVH